MPADMLPTVTYFATLLGFGILIMHFTKRHNISEAFFLLLVGLVFGPTVLNLVNVGSMGDIPVFLRTLALVVIAFASAFHLKLSTFKRVSTISLKLAFGGFFFAMITTALLAHSIFSLSWIGSFILGAVIGGSSSSAIVTFRGTLKEEKDTLDILLIESIFSDPLTVLVPLLLLGFLVGTISHPTTAISQFWQLIAAGVGTGVVIGFAAVHVFRRTQKELSPILGFAIALITYAAAGNIGGSGILAVAICAIILGNMKIPFKKDIGGFEDSLSIMLNISVFTLLGAQISLMAVPGILMKELLLIGALIFIIRPAFSVFALINEQMDLKEILLVSFTGPRGAACAAIAAIPLSIAVKEGLTSFIPEAEIILITAFMAVLLTILSSTIFGLIFSKYKEDQEEEKEKEAKKSS
ncbi:MAG: cation:proton antiporter [Candidatus Undinarchaeales archaeon]